MSTGPEVARTVWTEADFDVMGWHDNKIHAMAVEPGPDYPGRLLLDLDYIIEWVAPEPPARDLSSWICPATLVFDPASPARATAPDRLGHTGRMNVLAPLGMKLILGRE